MSKIHYKKIYSLLISLLLLAGCSSGTSKSSELPLYQIQYLTSNQLDIATAECYSSDDSPSLYSVSSINNNGVIDFAYY